MEIVVHNLCHNHHRVHIIQKIISGHQIDFMFKLTAQLHRKIVGQVPGW